MKTISLFIVSLFILTGCMYESLDALQKAKRDNAKIYKYNDGLKFVENRVEGYMKKCHNSNPETVFTAVNGMAVEFDRKQPSDYEKKAIPNGVLIYIHINHKFYTLGAEITSINEGNTQLRLYANNYMWANNFDNIHDYITTGELVCNKL